jgi:hypothetical protein
MNLRACIVGFGLLVFVVAGCGGSGGNTSSATADAELAKAKADFAIAETALRKAEAAAARDQTSPITSVPVNAKANSKDALLEGMHPFFSLLDKPLAKEEESFIGRRSGIDFTDTKDAQEGFYEIIYRRDHTYSWNYGGTDQDGKVEWYDLAHGIWCIIDDTLYMVDLVTETNLTTPATAMSSEWLVMKSSIGPVEANGRRTLQLHSYTDLKGELQGGVETVEAPLAGLFTSPRMKQYDRPNAIQQLDIRGMVTKASWSLSEEEQ